MEHKKIQELKKKSLTYSIWDGSFWSVMYGFGESFFSAFAVFMNATNLQLGFLASFPQMIGSFFQLLSYKMIETFHSRKKTVVFFALLQAFLHIPIALVFFFGEFKVIYLILFVCIYFILGMLAGPAWTSWMGDLVDENKRGSYFGVRNKICGSVSFISYLLAGYILQNYNTNSYVYFGFFILFMIAFLARIVSAFFLTKKYEPEFELEPQKTFGIIEFLKEAKNNSFGVFVFFLCFFNFSVAIAGPFFVPYMLNDLKLNYIIFTIINATAMVTKIIVMPLWGKACDRFGERKIIAATGLLMPLIPILWVFSTNPYYLILIHIFTGFVWAGVELSTFNYIFSSTEPQKRVSYVAYYNVLNGISVFLGAIVGGIIVKYNHLLWSSYLLVFIISGILRAAAFIIFVPKLKEPRTVQHITNSKLLIDIMLSMPQTAIRDLFVPISRINTLRKKIIQRHLIRDIEEMFLSYPRHKIRDIDEMFNNIENDRKEKEEQSRKIQTYKDKMKRKINKMKIKPRK